MPENTKKIAQFDGHAHLIHGIGEPIRIREATKDDLETLSGIYHIAFGSVFRGQSRSVKALRAASFRTVQSGFAVTGGQYEASMNHYVLAVGDYVPRASSGT